MVSEMKHTQSSVYNLVLKCWGGSSALPKLKNAAGLGDKSHHLAEQLSLISALCDITACPQLHYGSVYTALART